MTSPTKSKDQKDKAQVKKGFSLFGCCEADDGLQYIDQVKQERRTLQKEKRNAAASWFNEETQSDGTAFSKQTKDSYRSSQLVKKHNLAAILQADPGVLSNQGLAKRLKEQKEKYERYAEKHDLAIKRGGELSVQELLKFEEEKESPNQHSCDILDGDVDAEQIAQHLAQSDLGSSSRNNGSQQGRTMQNSQTEILATCDTYQARADSLHYKDINLD